MSDQVTTVDPETSLLDAIGGEPEKEEGEAPAAEAAAEVESEEAAPEAESENDADAMYRVTIKDEAGTDVDKDVSVGELAKGYMLQADYTRKTQELASQRHTLEVQYSKALHEQQSKSVEDISRLQELVLSQAAPELNGVDWVSLSVQDPAKFVELKARQEQMQGTLYALEQQKARHQQAQEQAITQAVTQVLKASDEVLAREIPGINAAKTEELLGAVEKHIGWKRGDLQIAAKALASAGMHPQTLGKVLVLAHKAIQYDAMKTAAPAALQKVAQAPKLVKPAAAQPKQTNQEAVKRLQRSGRIEDLAALIR